MKPTAPEPGQVQGRSARVRLRLVLATFSLAVAGAAPVLAAYPERPITLVVPWAAGGGTDATARFVATLLEKELRQPVNVVNRTGGGGIVGHTEIANARPDGYTLGVVTTELSLYKWLGTSQLTHANYTPLALYNTDPVGIHVRADNGPRTMKELMDTVAAKPGAIKASGANLGGLAHLSVAGLLTSLQRPVSAMPWVPSEGSAPSLQLLTSGAIDVVATTMPEAQTMVDARRVRSIAIMKPVRDPAYPDVPTIKESLGVDGSLGAWRGIAGPKGLHADVTARLGEALRKVVGDPEFKKLMDARKFGVEYADPAGFAAYLVQAEARFGVAAKAAGLAK
jgi:tripartite-type tricarboxylate transporter receptor subunit TctC